MAYECLGAIASLRDDAASAQLYLRQAAELGPERADVHRATAAVMIRMNRLDAARTAMEAAERLESSSSSNAALLGLISAHTGDDAAAIAHLRASHAMAPRDEGTTRALVAALQGAGQFEEAHSVLDRALSRVPRHQRPVLLLAKVRILCAIADSVDKRQARPWLEEADTAAQRAVAETALRATRDDRPSSPDDRRLADANYHHAIVLQRRGQHRAARRSLAKASRLDPTHHAANRAEDLLGSVHDYEYGSPQIGLWSAALASLGLLVALIALVGQTVHDISKHTIGTELLPVVVVGALCAVVGASLPRWSA